VETLVFKARYTRCFEGKRAELAMVWDTTLLGRDPPIISKNVKKKKKKNRYNIIYNTMRKCTSFLF